VFVAGATGVVGAPLSSLLLDAGFVVYGTTRKRDRAAALQAYGIRPVVIDVFDGRALRAAVTEIAPWAVIHQLTDLPLDLNPALMAEASIRNARLREEGTRNLVATQEPTGACPVHVEAAAWAALLALRYSTGGIFNVTDPCAQVSSLKVKQELSWDPLSRLPRF